MGQSVHPKQREEPEGELGAQKTVRGAPGLEGWGNMVDVTHKGRLGFWLDIMEGLSFDGCWPTRMVASPEDIAFGNIKTASESSDFFWF